MPATEFDSNGVERVTLQEEGWRSWHWKGHACNYISAGQENAGPIVVLVHGFGAHSYHWRYTIPALARRGFRVYALCMLGYGWSPKVVAPYSMEFWGEQVIDFCKEVAKATESDKAVIAGNSIGALAALYAASRSPRTTKGLCLVNSAGNFAEGAEPGPEKKTLAQKAVLGKTRKEMRDPTDETAAARMTVTEKLQESFGKLVATGVFYFTKIRIKSILQQVYESEPDADLVRSIELAAEDPGAIDTFYQLSLAGGRTKSTAGDLLEKYDGPLMLLWGEKDPWMTPSKASRILEMKPDAYYAPVAAGHCPHDDAPVECSAKLGDWAEGLAASA
jgi:pimeloyl-ACP methyl ester carboxylesterase